MHAIFFKDSCDTIFEAESQRNGCVTLAYLFDVSNVNEVSTNSMLLFLQIKILSEIVYVADYFIIKIK